MANVKQGDIIALEGNVSQALVLSKDVFNKTGLCVVCPVVKKASTDALHIPIQKEGFSGIALCEHLRSLDLRKRYYKTVDTLPFSLIQEVSDAVQSVFDCYPYSIL